MENDEIDVEEEITMIDTDQMGDIKRQRIVVDKLTPNYLSQTEMISVVTRRADMLRREAPPYVITSETDPSKIALIELVQGRIPMSIERSRGFREGIEYIEIFDVNEMIITKKCFSSISSIINIKDKSINLKDEIKKLLSDDN